MQKRAPLYDKSQEGHYNLISALHKSMRGSDPDAALYWLARMLDGGEDPLFIARRIVRFANEDIGIADPNAVHQALAAWDVYERLGLTRGGTRDRPGRRLPRDRAQVDRASTAGSAAARAAAKRTGSLMPPAHILNAPTRLMKDLGYGEGYQYDPDTEDGFSGRGLLPRGHGARDVLRTHHVRVRARHHRKVASLGAAPQWRYSPRIRRGLTHSLPNGTPT